MVLMSEGQEYWKIPEVIPLAHDLNTLPFVSLKFKIHHCYMYIK